MRATHQLSFLIAVFAVISLVACGGGSGSSTHVAPPAPTFTSTPVTDATEGVAYTYQLAATDPAGGAITFALTTAPTGATLSGSTISWTPTAAQSRLPNSFTVTATTSAGGTATHSWTVSPAGTVRVSWIDTYWNSTGSTAVPFDWTPVLPYVGALVPHADGSSLFLNGTGGADGILTIPNVPAGYYWLLNGRFTYWTSTSNFDFGAESLVPRITVVPGTPNSDLTTISFNFAGVDPVDGGLVNFVSPDMPFFSFGANTRSDSSTVSGTIMTNAAIDFSGMKTGFALEYKPVSMGALNGMRLGPALTLSDLALTPGTAYNITGTLTPSPEKTINLNVKGSAWTPLFAHVAPSAVTQTTSPLSVSVQPYISRGNVNAGGYVDLLYPVSTPAPSGNSTFSAYPFSGCSTSFRTSGFYPPIQPPPITTDQDLGSVAFGDPFPAAWPRVFAFCQQAELEISVPDSETTQKINLGNSMLTALPTAPVTPIISPVQNPTVNGLDIFSPATLSTTAVTLSWQKPAIGTPYGYTVEVLTPVTFNDGTRAFLPGTKYGTANTSVTLPPKTLAPGNTYRFVITALTDARANMESSPRRSAIPSGNADIISAPITISPSAPVAQ